VGVGGDATDQSAPFAGAVLQFQRTGTTWSQRSYLKSSNTRAGMQFGSAVALGDDVLCVGAEGESGGSPGIGGDQTLFSAPGSGAVYAF
jgi:hypothetical protein